MARRQPFRIDLEAYRTYVDHHMIAAGDGKRLLAQIMPIANVLSWVIEVNATKQRVHFANFADAVTFFNGDE